MTGLLHCSICKSLQHALFSIYLWAQPRCNQVGLLSEDMMSIVLSEATWHCDSFSKSRNDRIQDLDLSRKAALDLERYTGLLDHIVASACEASAF